MTERATESTDTHIPSRVVIINDASTALGGATGLALLSAELLAARKIPVTYIAGDDGKGERLAHLGVDVVSVGGRGLITEKAAKAAIRGIYNRETRRVLGGWIAEHDAPGFVYHLHGWSKILSPSVFDALRPVASRTIIHAHDFFLACPNGGFMDYPNEQPCERTPLSAACIVTNCDKRSRAQKVWRVARQHLVRPRVTGLRWAQFLMIHSLMAPYLEKAGLDPALLHTLPNPSLPFSETRIPVENNKAFLFVGRLEPEKGVEDAIAAAAIAGIPLKIVGDGPLKSELEKKHPSLEFYGWRTREEIATIAKDARALIMPSRYPEPYGLVAVEAARTGLPVILAETAFLSQDFVRYEIGFRCSTRDPQELAKVIRHICEMSKDELRTISHRACTEVNKLSTTPDAWIDQLIAHYSMALTSATRLPRHAEEAPATLV